ncbi:MAG TPA: helix-turn-helix transcriptional regulator [Thermoanaerobaculia bacterium]|jgi:transcriptional regulator with XRE-family HTH domain|nr:helix-turn-helix transcriptional regulator [Thermoanaerobaculia bacterium]
MKPEIEHVIQVIRSAMRVLGFTNREVERRLGVSGGYLTRLFSGVMELRFEHIVDISRAIGLEPQELFELVYTQPRKPPTEAAQRIRETFGPAPLEPPVPVAKVELPRDEESLEAVEQGMERMMMKMLRKLFAEMMAKGAVGE